MTEQEMPNPEHPAWQKICPFSGMTHATCDKPDTPEGLSVDHVTWHTERMVEVGAWETVGGADDPDQVHYRMKEGHDRRGS